jgi:hypothetical protein
MNRFDLEDAMSRMLDIDNELDDVIHRVGDSPEPPTEDQLLNMLIGIKELNNTRYSRMWNIFETLIKNDVITSTDNIT